MAERRGTKKRKEAVTAIVDEESAVSQQELYTMRRMCMRALESLDVERNLRLAVGQYVFATGCIRCVENHSSYGLLCNECGAQAVLVRRREFLSSYNAETERLLNEQLARHAPKFTIDLYQRCQDMAVVLERVNRFLSPTHIQTILVRLYQRPVRLPAIEVKWDQKVAPQVQWIAQLLSPYWIVYEEDERKLPHGIPDVTDNHLMKHMRAAFGRPQFHVPHSRQDRIFLETIAAGPHLLDAGLYLIHPGFPHHAWTGPSVTLYDLTTSYVNALKNVL